MKNPQNQTTCPSLNKKNIKLKNLKPPVLSSVFCKHVFTVLCIGITRLNCLHLTFISASKLLSVWLIPKILGEPVRKSRAKGWNNGRLGMKRWKLWPFNPPNSRKWALSSRAFSSLSKTKIAALTKKICRISFST